VAILGFDRAVEFGRSGRPLEAAAYGLLCIAATSAVAGALVFAVIVMVDK
jgi:hypothetical protein